MQSREALFLSLMVTNCSGKGPFQGSKELNMKRTAAMFQERLSTYAFGTLKVTNLGKQTVLNS